MRLIYFDDDVIRIEISPIELATLGMGYGLCGSTGVLEKMGLTNGVQVAADLDVIIKDVVRARLAAAVPENRHPTGSDA